MAKGLRSTQLHPGHSKESSSEAHGSEEQGRPAAKPRRDSLNSAPQERSCPCTGAVIHPCALLGKAAPPALAAPSTVYNLTPAASREEKGETQHCRTWPNTKARRKKGTCLGSFPTS